MIKTETHIYYIANIVLGTVIYVLCHLISTSSMKWDLGPGEVMCLVLFLMAITDKAQP